MSRFERWSRLKRGEVPASTETVAPPHEGDTADRQPLETDVSARAAEPAPGSLDHTLPDPDTLPVGSDIKAYLASGVSSGLRKRALRRLFAADHYGIRDGLDDYDDDYREKLKPLAGEVAERLRNWTRRQPEDDDQAPEASTWEETGEASHAEARPVASDDDPAEAQASRENPGKEQPDRAQLEDLAHDASSPSGAP